MPETWNEFWSQILPPFIMFMCALGGGWLSGWLTRDARRAAEDYAARNTLAE